MNKVVNVTLTGGIIGLLGDSPQSSLNRAIRRENAKGWRVVQVVPSASGNIFLIILRLFLLMITLLFYTTANGYYLIMEKSDESESNKTSTSEENEVKFILCKNCGEKQADNCKFCEYCGSQL